MSGFHPILGLLAVAVCISYAEGAPFLDVQEEDIPVNKLLKTDLHQSEQSARNNGPLRSPLYLKKEKISKRDDDSQYAHVINKRNYENINQDESISKFQDLRGIDEAALAKADARGSDSGDINQESGASGGILGSAEPSVSSEGSYSESEESAGKQSTENDESTLGSAVQASGSEEDCDDEENKGQVSSTPSSVSEQSPVEDTTAPSETIEPTDETVTTGPDDGCEEEESTPQSPTNSSDSNESVSKVQESEENDDCEKTTSPTPPKTTQQSTRTRPTTPRKKPSDDNSSGLFDDSDPDGIQFSDSNSDESAGGSTEFHDKLID